MAVALELPRYNDPAVQELRVYRGRERSRLSRFASAVNFAGFGVIPLAAVLSAVAIFLLAMDEYTLFAGAVLVGSIVSTMAALGAIIVARNEARGENALRGSIADARTEATSAIDSWLASTYGLTIDDYWGSDVLAELVLENDLGRATTWTLKNPEGVALEGRFIEVAPGTIELRKATVADTDESIYFKPVLAAV